MNPLLLMDLGAVLICLVARVGLTPALAVGGISAAGAAFAAGRVVVPTFYAVASLVALIVVAEFVTRRGGPPPRVPGLPLLLLFTGYATVVTFVVPILLPDAIGGPTTREAPRGLPTVSNLAQVIYLVLAVALVVYVARDRRTGPGVLGITVVGATLLSFWRFLSQNAGLPFPEGVFDNSPGPVFIESAANNVKRFRGIFSEPAALATSSLATAVWCVCTLPGASPVGRVWRVAVAGAAIFLGFVSTSTTFVIAAPIVVLIAFGAALVSVMRRGARIPLLTSAAAVALVGAVLLAIVPVASYLQATVNAKAGTASYDDRNTSNSELYDVFVNSWGLGGGLGAARGSSFFATLAGTTGVIGVLLLVAVVFFYLRWGAVEPEYRAVAWTLITVLTVKVVSGPDLNDPSGLTWLSLGLLAQAVYRRRLPSQPGDPAGALRSPVDPTLGARRA